MGVWGTSVLSDDTARDAYDSYIDLFNRGASPEANRQKLETQFKDTLNDPDEGPVFWFAVAKAQWDCGQLEPQVLSRVKQIITQDEGLDRWREQGPAILQKRKAVLQQLLAKLNSPNDRVRHPHKAVKRKPVFQPGDCVAVKLDNGNWGALLVLAGEPESDDPYVETYGKNLVGILRYESPDLPALPLFEAREWFRCAQGKIAVFYVMTRFRGVKGRFVRIGAVPLRETDPNHARAYTSWPSMTMKVWDRQALVRKANR